MEEQKKKRPTYKRLEAFNNMTDEVRILAIWLNYKRLGAEVFRVFAEELKKEQVRKTINSPNH